MCGTRQLKRLSKNTNFQLICQSRTVQIRKIFIVPNYHLNHICPQYYLEEEGITPFNFIRRKHFQFNTKHFTNESGFVSVAQSLNFYWWFWKKSDFIFFRIFSSKIQTVAETSVFLKRKFQFWFFLLNWSRKHQWCKRIAPIKKFPRQKTQIFSKNFIKTRKHFKRDTTIQDNNNNNKTNRKSFCNFTVIFLRRICSTDWMREKTNNNNKKRKLCAKLKYEIGVNY